MGSSFPQMIDCWSGRWAMVLANWISYNPFVLYIVVAWTSCLIACTMFFSLLIVVDLHYYLLNYTLEVELNSSCLAFDMLLSAWNKTVLTLAFFCHGRNMGWKWSLFACCGMISMDLQLKSENKYELDDSVHIVLLNLSQMIPFAWIP